MKDKSRIVLTSLLIILLGCVFAQDVPCIDESRLVNWQNAGLFDEPSSTANNVININSYSGSDYTKVISAINDANLLPGTTIIYFPQGTYTIDNTINISNLKTSGIIFQGCGSEQTVLQFDGIDTDNNCFEIYGQYSGNQKSVDTDISKGSQWLYTNDGTSDIAVGDWVHFREPGFDDDYPDDDSHNGQISQVVEINDYDIKLKDEASKFYDASNSMWVRKIIPAYNIGFENFKIERTNTTKGYGCTFRFEKAVNCWVRGVESYKCTGYHIAISRSSHIEVSGCYIHHATNYNSFQGTGYGVVLGASTTNNLIENNIFKKTRHAMLVGCGANCNVFAYNYSREQEWDFNFLYPGADICIHGRYPYANLFEENTIDFIMADPSHGNNGPYNTFLRNRHLSNTSIVIFNSSYTNIVGNLKVSDIVTNPSWLIQVGYTIYDVLYGTNYSVNESTHTIDHYFNYYPEGPNWDWGWTSVTHGLWWSAWYPDAFYRSVVWPRSFLNDISYYYNEKPDFVNEQYSWPSHGPSTNIDRDNSIYPTCWNIPAEDRWEESIKTYVNPTGWYSKTYFSGQYAENIKFPSSLMQAIYINGDLTVSSGATLTIEAGVPIYFFENAQLIINGSLIAEGTVDDPILFTLSPYSSGKWDGIKFNDSSVDASCILKYCEIEYADYGVYAYSSSPTIHSCWIHDNTYGLRGYSSSMIVNNNKIYNNSQDGGYLYRGTPRFYNNTVYSNTGNGLKFFLSSGKIGYTSGTSQGKNEIRNNGDWGVYAKDLTEIFMGSSDSEGNRIGGYNTVMDNVINEVCSYDAHVEAEYNYWGTSSPNINLFTLVYGGTIDYIPYLTSDPNGGSGLSKSVGSPGLNIIANNGYNRWAGYNPSELNLNKLSDLWLYGLELTLHNRPEKAIEIYKMLIEKFPESKEAKKAMVKIHHLLRESDEKSPDNYFENLLHTDRGIKEEYKSAALTLAAHTYVDMDQPVQAIGTFEKIVQEYPDSSYALDALFSLVMLNLNSIKDSSSAKAYLEIMKREYPFEEQTLIARTDMGEKVDWSALGKRIPKPKTSKIDIPTEFALHNNYPNPFNPMTNIRFDLPEATHVTITIYDITGREVIKLVNQNMNAGYRNIIWDAKDKYGRNVSSGLYIYQMRTGTGFNKTDKMILTR